MRRLTVLEWVHTHGKAPTREVTCQTCSSKQRLKPTNRLTGDPIPSVRIPMTPGLCLREAVLTLSRVSLQRCAKWHEVGSHMFACESIQCGNNVDYRPRSGDRSLRYSSYIIQRRGSDPNGRPSGRLVSAMNESLVSELLHEASASNPSNGKRVVCQIL